MEINFDQKLHNLEGLVLKTENDEITLKYAAIVALMGSHEDERGLGGGEKFARYDLAKRINDGETQVTAEEITKLKTLIGKAFGPSVVGPAFVLLEGASKREWKDCPEFDAASNLTMPKAGKKSHAQKET